MGTAPITVHKDSSQQHASFGKAAFTGGGILGYNATSRLFAQYNEAAPRTLIGGTLNGFFLNFNQSEGVYFPGTTIAYDGAKNLFGDLGNSWIVGGNGLNNLFGGFGDDLLDGRRNLTIDGGLSDLPDNNPYFNSVVFGGAGANTLIAGGAYDRLIDWAGNFNTYIVPFAPWGMPTVSRTLQPALMTYLYQLSAADGADNLYADYNAPGLDNVSGLDPTRNGEPYGEIGLVDQHDPFWHLQTGAPNQQPPGNLGGVQRLITGKFTASSGILNPIAPATGAWTLANGAITASPTTTGASTFAAFNDTEYLPDYYEMTSTVTPGTAAKGGLSNGYVIYDYVSSTDFKFAGVDASTGSIELGHYNGTSWVVDASAAEKIVAAKSYGLLLAVNGTTATLTVNSTWTINYTYAARLIQGTPVNLNYGAVGLGSNDSTATYGDTALQVLVMPTTVSYTESFKSAPKYFDAPAAGAWTYNGSYSGTVPSNGFAIVNIDLGLALGMQPGTFALQPSSSLEITAVMKQVWPRAGLVYDMFGTGQFNFAALFVDTQQVVLGHYTAAGGWVLDAVKSYKLNSGTSYTLDLLAGGNTVNLSVNGTVQLTYAYGELTTAGKFGLLTVGGTTTFASVQTQSNDPAFQTTAKGTPTLLQVEAEPAPATPNGLTNLNNDQLAPIVVEARQLWINALGAGDPRLSALNSVSVAVGDLGPGLLAETTGDSILIDRNAAGWGWFVDPSPQDNSEFSIVLSSGVYAATPSSPAHGRMDLLTSVVHELGNAMGFAEDLGQDVAGMTLQAGERRVPVAGVTQPSGAASVEAASALAATVSLDPAFVSMGAFKLNLDALMPATIELPPLAGPAPLAPASQIIVSGASPMAMSFGLGHVGGAQVSVGSEDQITTQLLSGRGSNGTPAGDVQADTAVAQQHSSRVVNESAAPIIKWDERLGNPEKNSSGSPAGQDWLDDFLNHLGQNENQRNPNASLRVRPSASVHGGAQA